MRHRKALLPQGDAALFERTLLDARFLGLDWLEAEVKAQAWKHLDHREQQEAVQRYNDSHCDAALQSELGSYNRFPDATAVALFDVEYGSLENALARGHLPDMFFRPLHFGEVKIKQLIPCHRDDGVAFYDESHHDEPAEVRKALCLALVENWHGATHIEPVVRGRGIALPRVDRRGGGAWLTTERHEQLVTASRYNGDEGIDGERNWAYAYKVETSRYEEVEHR